MKKIIKREFLIFIVLVLIVGSSAIVLHSLSPYFGEQRLDATTSATVRSNLGNTK